MTIDTYPIPRKYAAIGGVVLLLLALASVSVVIASLNTSEVEGYSVTEVPGEGIEVSLGESDDIESITITTDTGKEYTLTEPGASQSFDRTVQSVTIVETTRDGETRVGTEYTTQYPELAVEFSSQTLQLGEDLVVDASDSYSPRNEPLTVDITSTDGIVTSTNSTATVAFDSAGEKSVTVRVESASGAVTQTFPITVHYEPPTVRIDRPSVILADSPVSFALETNSTIRSYAWDLGDGETATTAIATTTYPEPGTYSVQVEVTDSKGAMAHDSISVTVHGDTTKAIIDGARELQHGNAVELDATRSFDPSWDIVAYHWDLGDGTTSTDPSLSHTYAESGTYDVTLTIENELGKTASTSTSITMLPPAPVANAGSRKTAAINERVTFHGGRSSIEDGGTLSYSWDFGDGSSATGETVTTQYGAIGGYTVTLTVTDERGNTATDTTRVSVQNRVPTAVATSTTTTAMPEDDITFNAGTSADPDEHALSYQWDFGDGGQTVASETALRTFPSPGTYKVTLTVTDEYGLEDTDIIYITIENTPPTAAAGEDKIGYNDDTFTFDASGSDDPDGARLSYEWSFEDGSTATGVTTERSFGEVGEQEVTLTVTDSNDASDTDTVTVTIQNRPPIADAGEDQTVTSPAVVQFDGTRSIDPDGQDLTYEWSFGDGATATTAAPEHEYTEPGTYSVTLIVTDEHAVSDSATVTITVK